MTSAARGRTEVIVKAALINAAAVGSGGFLGAHSRLHTAKILRLSSDLPIVIEVVDTEEKIEAFLPIIDDAVEEGLATVERVEVHFYRSRCAE